MTPQKAPVASVEPSALCAATDRLRNSPSDDYSPADKLRERNFNARLRGDYRAPARGF